MLLGSRSSLLGLLILSLSTVSVSARADDPTTAECLSASERTLQLRGQRKLRAAREQALVCAATSCPADVRVECERRIHGLNDAIPTVVFEVRDKDGTDLTGVRVSMDGTRLTERLEGSAISIDPGEHTFLFEAEGRGRLEKKILIREGEKNRHETIVLEGASHPGSAPALVPTPAPAPSPQPPPPEHAEQSTGGTQRVVGLVIAGVGLAGLGVGTALGFAAKSRYDDSAGYCTGNFCDPDGGAIRDDARGTGNVGTAVFIVGAAALVGGLALWLTAPSAKTSSTAISPRLGSRTLLREGGR
ncbi:MAG: hypothetical protein KF819_21425 [Labilithrix sp.]|nr:hypothetical protein [Labilithrix sp.]